MSNQELEKEITRINETLAECYKQYARWEHSTSRIAKGTLAGVYKSIARLENRKVKLAWGDDSVRV